MKKVHLSRKTLIGVAAALTLVISVFSANAVLGQSRPRVASTTKLPVTAKRASNVPTSVGHLVNFHGIRARTGAAATSTHSSPVFLGVSPKLAKAKASATHNSHAPAVAATIASAAQSRATGPALNTPFQFQGMQDSASICQYFGGCQPPDMAVASSPTKVLQVVNTSYQLYTPTGGTIFGPINSQVFNDIPNPTPAGCDTGGVGPFTSDPRAFYDPNTGFFFTAMLQVEGAPGFGVAPNCNFVSKYWIAAINASTLSVCVYNFNMSLDGINAADYTQLGFNKDVVSFSGNMFNATAGTYSYAEAGFVNKAAMEKCHPVTPVFFSQLAIGTVSGGTDFVDTVNPVDTETPTLSDPGVEYLVNAFNMNGDPFGDDCLFTACHGFLVWAFDPATNVLSGVLEDQTIPADNYISPPNADQPICTQCVETIDTRVTATPVYSVGSGTGLISFSIDTGANNNIVHTVPAILWGQLEPALTGGQVFFAGMYQSSYLVFAGDQDASFGAMMQDKNGRIVMVFDTMSATINPSIMYTSRLASDPLGSLRVPQFLFTGPTPTFDSRWGDFEAASYDGFSTNHMWVASQYSVGDWATFVARLT